MNGASGYHLWLSFQYVPSGFGFWTINGLILFNNCTLTMFFIDDHNTSLSPVDVLLLSRTTLRQCNIILQTCSASLVLSTIRLRASLGWI